MLSRIVIRRSSALQRSSNSSFFFSVARMKPIAVRCWFSSGGDSSITYSGGQATEGQGGYYGSGGARVISSSDVQTEGRQAVLAIASDVQKIASVMDELETLENLLRSEEKASSKVTTKSIEIKSAIKKLMTHPEVLDALNRLEIEGEPVWGLSSEEREMIVTAREKVNEC